MAYPFLYIVAGSVLQKLKDCKLENFEDPKYIKEVVEFLKDILPYLPSIVKTHESTIARIQKSVFGLHDLLREQKPSWTDISIQLNDLGHILWPPGSKDNSKLLSSISYALPEFEGQAVKNTELPPHLVLCLAYCALYPKSYRIVRENLVNQWMAEGFLDLEAAGSSSGDTELEDIGDRYFMELFSMGVFVKPMFCFGGNISNQQEAVTVHSCQLHDDIHDFVREIADKEVLVPDSYEPRSRLYDQRSTMYLALHQAWDEEFPKGLRTCKSFFSHIDNDVLASVLKSPGLQILDLGGTQFDDLEFLKTWSKKQQRSEIGEWPGTMFEDTFLTHSRTKFRGLFIGDQARTESEDRPRTEVEERPKIFKGKYLAFSGNTRLQRIDDFLEDSKHQLQTLAVDGCVQLKEVNLKHTSCLRHLYYTSKEPTLQIHTSSLRILQLSECSELRSLSLDNVNFSALRRLRIYECPALVSLPDIMDLLIHVEELVFHNCVQLDLNFGRSMNSLPKLHHMELIGLPKLTELPIGLKSAKGALKYLMVANCPDLSIEPGVFQSLTALQPLDITLKPSETTFSARSRIPEVILDGQLLDRICRGKNIDIIVCQNAGLPRGIDVDLGPQTPSLPAQTEPCLPRNFPYFSLSLEASKELSEGPVKEDVARARYFFLFHRDYEFEKETLVQLWKGLLPHATERFGKKSFDRFLGKGYIFKSRTDFLTGREKYKIDVEKVTTDFKELKSRDLYAMIDFENMKERSSTYWRHVSIVSKGIDEEVFEILKGPIELKSVFFIPDYGSSINYGSSIKQIPSLFFKVLQHTRVLNLSGINISELPSSIGEMTNLHCLDLSLTLIARLPESICRLQKLQTLTLRECKHLRALPKGMKSLVNLRHLHFDVLGQLTSMPEGLRCLTKLRTLSAFIVSKQDGCSLAELGDMKKLRGNFCISGLEYATVIDARAAKMEEKEHPRLHLKWNYSKCYEDNDREHAFLVANELESSSIWELQMSYYPGSKYPNWIENSIHLKMITLLRCDFETLPIEQLRNLYHLEVIDLNKVTKMGSFEYRAHGVERYHGLKTLVIDGMLSLRCWHKVQEGDYPCLSKLIISNCPELSELPAPLLSSLKYLEISDCKSIESLPIEALPRSLDTLLISNCPSLKCDWTQIEDREDLNKWIDTIDKDKDEDLFSEESDEEESNKKCAETPPTSV